MNHMASKDKDLLRNLQPIFMGLLLELGQLLVIVARLQQSVAQVKKTSIEYWWAFVF